jgi:hypothetical protein
VTPRRYRRKPIEVEAVQLDPADYDAMCAVVGWCEGRPVGDEEDNGTHILAIDTREGPMYADAGDWIIKEPFPTEDRRFYPCKASIFEATYEPVEEPAPSASGEEPERAMTVAEVAAFYRSACLSGETVNDALDDKFVRIIRAARSGAPLEEEKA